MEKKNFSCLKLNPWLLRQLESVGVNSPTAIQANCIPPILNGLDCIGCAQTGSGKTLAFALPILQKLCEEPYGIFAVILTPTRELAYQIGDQFSILGKAINLRLCVITGGMDMIIQAQQLEKKPHILVATPGRLADHLESCNTFSLNRIKFLVFDEADRLLGGKFDDQIKTIFANLPAEKQILLFSATMTDTLEQVKRITKERERFVWVSGEETATVEKLKQFYVLCPADAKDGYLIETIRTFQEGNPLGSIIVFTDTCKNCQILSMALNEVGFENVPLHSVGSQKRRLAALAKFKSNQAKILLATDVASRGLDIPSVALIINHNIPNDAKDYIHRVGRTARAGKEGTAISLVTQRDVKLVLAIEEKVGAKWKEYPVKGKEVAKILTQVNVAMRESEIKLDETDFDERKVTNKRKKLIMEGKDPDEIEASLKEKWKELKRKRREERTTEEKRTEK